MEDTAPPTLTRSTSRMIPSDARWLVVCVTGAKAMAALATLASQAKGLTSALQRPKFLTTPAFQRKAEPLPAIKSHSSSALSTSDETSDETEERPSVDEQLHPPAAAAARASTSSSSRQSFFASRRSRLASEDAPPPPPVLLPWELRDESGDVIESTAVREKVLELSVYRRTFVEDADGEDDYTFTYATYKDVARRLLLSDPNLREKYASIVQNPPAFVVSEEAFWRNFFLHCNAVCVAEGLPSYLPPVVRSSMAAVASFQRFRRDVFLKTQRSSAELEKLRRSILQPKRTATTSMDESDPTLLFEEDELGDLELDLDGEIERELMRRRPSRAVAYHKSVTAANEAAAEANEASSETQ